MFYDTHAHLTYPELASKLPQILERAREACISKVVSIGTDLESSRQAIALAESHAAVYAAIGWHPSDAARAPEEVVDALRPLASHPKVVAIGEIGLDYYRLPSKQGSGTVEEDARYKSKQERIFRQQLQLAAELGLNCVVHQRDSFEDTIRIVEEFAGRIGTVFHCFSGSLSEMKRVLAAGSLVSFTGILTFKNAQGVRDTLAATPLDCFMLETDSPFLAPVPYRGKSCEPAYVKEIAETAAQVKGVSLDALSQATCATAEQFFLKLRA